MPGVRGRPIGTWPVEPGFSYHSESNMDLMQPVLSALATRFDEIGLPLRSIENEFGPGQVECTFAPRPALEAADQLSREDIEVEVIDPRTLKPLDLPTIVASVKKTGRLVIVEEGWRFCGLGAQIAESVYAAAFDYLDAPIQRVTGEDVPMPYSRPLEDAAIPDKARVIEAVKALCGAQ